MGAESGVSGLCSSMEVPSSLSNILQACLPPILLISFENRHGDGSAPVIVTKPNFVNRGCG